jgi:hypothetical protein
MMVSRKVNSCGKINWERQRYFLTTSLAGWNVGLQNVNGTVKVWFGRLLLGQIESSSASFVRADIRPHKAVESHENNEQNVTEVYTMS